MSTKKIPDTNVILRCLLADNEGQYHEISPFLKGLRVSSQRAIIPGEVVLEAFYVLAKAYTVPPKGSCKGFKRPYKGIKGMENKNNALLVEAFNRFEQSPGVVPPGLPLLGRVRSLRV